VGAALLAAVLFGASTPVAKALVGDVGPWMLAGLLYLGSGLGLALLRALSGAQSSRLAAREWPWLIGAVLTGGIGGPVLLMFGLSGMPASGASLLLNAEGVFTALLAWFAFKENFDRRIALGMLAIVAGALVLSWSADARFGSLLPALAVLGACLAWGIDKQPHPQGVARRRELGGHGEGARGRVGQPDHRAGAGCQPATIRRARGFGRSGLLCLRHQPDAVRGSLCATWVLVAQVPTSRWRHSLARCLPCCGWKNR
jgi:uncharacterized membrane protein